MNLLKKLTYPIWRNTFDSIARGWSLTGQTSFNQFFDVEDITANETTSQAISAVHACLRVYGESFAQLPKHVLKDDGNGKKIADKSSSVYKLINVSPNEYQTAFDFWYTITYFKYAWGNGLARIERFRGSAIRLTLLEPWECTPVINDGELYVIYKGEAIPYHDIFHLKNHSKNGYWGTSTLKENSETLTSALKLDKYGKNAIGEKPPAVIGTDQNLTSEQYKQIKEFWNNQNENEIGKTKVLGGGFKYMPTIIPPGDAQYIETREFTVGQIYSMFRIPPTFLQDYERATFSNAEQQDLIFVKHSLMPGIIQIEQEINKKLFAPSNSSKNNPYYAKINVKHFLRGDTQAQAALLDSMLSKGVFSPNQALEFLDMNPYEGGDRRYIQAGFIPVDRVDDFIDGKSPDSEIERLIKDSQNGKY